MCSRLRSGNDVIPWVKVVDKLQRNVFGANPIKIRICAINELADRDDTDFRVGDELIVYEAKTKEVQINLMEEGIEDEDDECIRVQVDIQCPFRVVPMYQNVQNNSKVFGSVGEMVDIFPAIDDVIYSVTQFTIGKTQIQAWDRLQVLGKFQDSSGVEFLEVKTERHGQNLMLPEDLEKKFVQMNADPLSPLVEPLSAREYKMKELAKYWTPKMGKMKIRLAAKEESSDKDISATSPVQKWFKKKKVKTKEKSLSVEETKKYEDQKWMIPVHWRNRVMEMLPIKIIYALKCAPPGSSIVIPGSFKMDVEILDYNAIDAKMYDDHKRRSSSGTSSEGAAMKLQELDLDSMLPPSKTDFAITAVVTSGATASMSKVQSPIRHRNTIAIHRARKVRKLLLTSPEMQHYLVTPNYGGVFQTIPPVYETVADIPTTGEAKYVTRRTSYPKEHQLDHCREGEIVQFIKTTENELGGITVRLTHCLVSSSPDIPPHAATYPDYLCGKFEPVDQSAPREFRARDLFNAELPCQVRLLAGDQGLGFDPLYGRKAFVVQEVVTEVTAIVGSARSETTGKNQLVEVATCRGSLTIEPTEGNLQIPITDNFNGFEKLPTVEIITYGDVESLRKANAHLQSRRSDKRPELKHTQSLDVKSRATTQLPRQTTLPSPVPKRRISAPEAPDWRGFAPLPHPEKAPSLRSKDNDDLDDSIYTRMHAVYNPLPRSPPESYSKITPKWQRSEGADASSPAHREKVETLVEEEDESDYVQPDGITPAEVAAGEPPRSNGDYATQEDCLYLPLDDQFEQPDYLSMVVQKPVPKPRKSVGESQAPYILPRLNAIDVPLVEEADSSEEDKGSRPPADDEGEIIIRKANSPTFGRTSPTGTPWRPPKPSVYKHSNETDC